MTALTCQDVRGGSPDHEQHAMSENPATANADVHQAILRLAGDSASGRAEETRTMLPQANLTPVW